MTFRDKTAMAWSNLGRRKVRTFLTSVGVIVGILTVVTMVSLVNGVQIQVKNQFEKIGLDRVVVRPQSSGGGSFPGFGGQSGDGEFDPFGLSVRTKIIAPADVKRFRAWPGVLSATPDIDLPRDLAAGLSIGQSDGKAKNTRAGAHRQRKRAASQSVSGRARTPSPGKLDLPAGSGSIVVSGGALKALKVKQKPRELIGQSATVTLATSRGERKSYTLKIIGVSDASGRAVQVSTGDRIKMKEWWFNEPDLLKNDGYDSVTLRATDVSVARTLVERGAEGKVQGAVD